jgi:superkiller protein 3
LLHHSNDAVKCAEHLQKLTELRRSEGSRTQLVEALSIFLPQSPIYNVISTLPPPDPTSPTATLTLFTQMAVQDSLPVLREIVALVEETEEETITKEVQKRRMRLGASGPEQLRRDVRMEVLGSSRVCVTGVFFTTIQYSTR